MSACHVCCSEYTRHKRKEIKCLHCDYSACQECYRTFLLSTQQDPHCMQCMHVWDQLFLRSHFAITWLHNAYKSHRERVLLEREKQLLPESQNLVHNYRESKRLRANIESNTQRLNDIRAEAWRLRQQISHDGYRAGQLEHNNYQGTNQQQNKRQRKEFMFPCPAEDCRGYMGSTEMVCGVCQAQACTKCGVILDEGHACDPNMAANFDAVKKASRPCPSCACPTSKIDGCDQMWCVLCHTAWSWNTGEIVKGVIHNPHFFAYLRETTEGDIPRQPGDNGMICRNERVPRGWDVSRKNRQFLSQFRYEDGTIIEENIQDFRIHERYTNSLLDFCRVCLHLSEDWLARQRREQDQTCDLRLKYLIHEITEDELKTLLQRREKRKLKQKDVADIYDMVVEVGGELLWAYVLDEKPLKESIDEMNRLRSYANTNLRSVGEKYHMTVTMV